MSETTNMVQSSQSMLTLMNAERAWQIQSPYGSDDRPEPVLADAIAAYRRRFKVPAEVELLGTATPWNNGAPAGPAVSIKVALASAAELAAKQTSSTPAGDEH